MWSSVAKSKDLSNADCIQQQTACAGRAASNNCPRKSNVVVQMMGVVASGSGLPCITRYTLCTYKPALTRFITSVI